jgi:protein involved in polysaccharide export with SLBB domain
MSFFSANLKGPLRAIVAVCILWLFDCLPLPSQSEVFPISASTNVAEKAEAQVSLRALRSGSFPGTNVPGVGLATNVPASRNGVKSGRIDTVDQLDDKYKLNIRDKISFRIIEDEDPPIELTVTDSGDLDVPYVGLYAAIGKTCKELARALKADLEQEYYYNATVIIALNQWANSQGKIYLVGPVRLPGPQEIPSDEVLTLSKAILRAGGFSDYADQRKVRVTRKSSLPGGKDKEFIINVEEILTKGNREGDLTLQDGDLVYVPERVVHF